MVDKPPLPPEETPILTGLANALKFVLKNLGKTNPVGTVAQVINPTEVGKGDLTPQMRENIRDYTAHGEEDGTPPPIDQDLEKWNSGDHIREFKTGRGSVYRWYGDHTMRNRSAAEHSDKTTGLQPASTKTIFLDETNKDIVRTYMGSLGDDISIKPDGPNTAKIIRNKAYGRLEPGVITKINYISEPQKGLYPFEIGSADSPAGQPLNLIRETYRMGNNKSDEVRILGQHMGNVITEVFDSTAKKHGGAVERNPYNYKPKAI